MSRIYTIYTPSVCSSAKRHAVRALISAISCLALFLTMHGTSRAQHNQHPPASTFTIDNLGSASLDVSGTAVYPEASGFIYYTSADGSAPYSPYYLTATLFIDGNPVTDLPPVEIPYGYPGVSYDFYFDPPYDLVAHGYGSGTHTVEWVGSLTFDTDADDYPINPGPYWDDLAYVTIP